VRIVLELFERTRVATRRGSVGAQRRLEPERFMRPLVVVLAPKLVERSLLAAAVAFGMLDELGQRPVKPLLAAVLLRLARRDPVVPDPEPLPPHRQRGQPAGPCRRKRWSVVRADGLGSAELLKRRVEDRPDVLGVRVDQRLA